METFTALSDLVDNPRYHQQRQKAIQALDLGEIDAPIVGIIGDLKKLPHCFTLQSCYEHLWYNKLERWHA